MPVGLAPVGMAGMYARRGETQAARAAAAASIPMCLSTVSLCSVEEVAATGTPPWFQLYVLKRPRLHARNTSVGPGQGGGGVRSWRSRSNWHDRLALATGDVWSGFTGL